MRAQRKVKLFAKILFDTFSFKKKYPQLFYKLEENNL